MNNKYIVPAPKGKIRVNAMQHHSYKPVKPSNLLKVGGA